MEQSDKGCEYELESCAMMPDRADAFKVAALLYMMYVLIF